MTRFSKAGLQDVSARPVVAWEVLYDDEDRAVLIPDAIFRAKFVALDPEGAALLQDTPTEASALTRREDPSAPAWNSAHHVEVVAANAAVKKPLAPEVLETLEGDADDLDATEVSLK